MDASETESGIGEEGSRKRRTPNMWLMVVSDYRRKQRSKTSVQWTQVTKES